MGLGANWHVVEGLYGIDYHDYSTFNELATDDPKSVDDTTFEVTIRKGAKFSDGTEVTADDVVASYTACAASAYLCSVSSSPSSPSRPRTPAP